MKKRKNLLFVLILIALLLSIIVFYFSLINKPNKILDKKEILLKLQIGNKSGFDVSKEELNFGMLTSENSASRNDVVVKNNYNFPIVLQISVEGNISDFLIFEDLVNLAPAQEKNLWFSTILITNESYGAYSGNAIILFRKAR